MIKNEGMNTQEQIRQDYINNVNPLNINSDTVILNVHTSCYYV